MNSKAERKKQIRKKERKKERIKERIKEEVKHTGMVLREAEASKANVSDLGGAMGVVGRLVDGELPALQGEREREGKEREKEKKKEGKKKRIETGESKE